MRPANLIPREDRRERGGGIRSAPLAYVLVGGLLLALGAVTLLVVTDNQVSTRKAEVAAARAHTAVAEARATELASYTQFHSLAAQRITTIENLANSRFDWEKEMRQLGLIAPAGLWLNNLTGTVRPDVSVGGGETAALRSSIPGPAISLSGCAVGQELVAAYVTQLKDVNGVTRVGVQSSGAGDNSSGESSGSGCAKGLVQFQLVVAFDAAPIPTAIAASEGAVEAPVEAPEESSETSEPAPEAE